VKPRQKDDELRAQIQEFLARKLPPSLGVGRSGTGDRPALARWREILRVEGLLAASWPVEYGGGGFTAMQNAILVREFAVAGAPLGERHDTVGVLVGLFILECGSAEQKATLLPRILSGEDRWCLGFSEPGAGSDLGDLACRAELRGDFWVINGQKIWTSHGLDATRMLLLARTNPDAPKHRGITVLIVDLAQPGIEIRPIRMITGESEFTETFLTDATTPAGAVVGEVDLGWKPAMAMTRIGRSGDHLVRIPRQFRGHLNRLLAVARSAGEALDPELRQHLARCECSVTGLELLSARLGAGVGVGADPDLASSLFKLYWSEHHKVAANLALAVLGTDALVVRGPWPVQWGPDDGPAGVLDAEGAGLPGDTASWLGDFLVAQAGTIYGGSVQIQRTILGEAALGLPREQPPVAGGSWRDARAKVAAPIVAGADSVWRGHSSGSGGSAEATELRELRGAVRRFLSERSPEATVRQQMQDNSGYDARTWTGMVELGLQGLLVPSRFGGAGAGMTEMIVVLEEMGRALLCAPFLSSAILAPVALSAVADPATAEEFLPSIASGERIISVIAPAWGSGPAGSAADIRASQSAGHAVLSGKARMVTDGMECDTFLVFADVGSQVGPSLYAVRADAAGVTRSPLRTLDATRRCAAVDFDGVVARLLGEVGGAGAALDAVRENGAAALCAEQVGGAAHVLESSVAHAKMRVQYGRPIGSFQAIKHLCADTLLDVEVSFANAQAIARAIDGSDPDTPRLVSVAKATCSETFSRAASTNIQIHGGIGFTWEHSAHLYLRRAKASELMFGSPGFHRERVARMLGL
jgi:alkylation response protein AidB-like acyl-CoA dehydrogenase